MKKLLQLILIFLLCVPVIAEAAAPVGINSYAFNYDEMTAKAYIVVDKQSGDVLLQKNADMLWTPASLTKLVTAMVVLDTNPKLAGYVTMAKDDEVGGARLATAAGVKYKLKDVFYGTLIASTNNGANAIARSTGLSREQFVARMNQKAKELGATQTVFVEPSGMDPKNVITAQDFAKIAKAAFAYSTIEDADNKATYAFKSIGGKKVYSHNLKTTNKLLSDGSFLITGAKTGYLEESLYNFTAELKDVDGKNIIVVLLGSRNPTAQFFETKKLAIWAWTNFSWKAGVEQVAGASTGFVGLRMP